jgi:hypothetical protein
MRVAGEHPHRKLPVNRQFEHGLATFVANDKQNTPLRCPLGGLS